MQMLISIALLITHLRPYAAVPVSCYAAYPDQNYNSISESIESNYTTMKSIISHPLLALLKEFGENEVKTIYNHIKYGLINEAEYSCRTCKLVIGLAKISIYSTRELNYVLHKSCSEFGFEDQRVCEGLSNLYTDQLYFILKNTNLTTDDVCGILIGVQCMDKPCGQFTNWKIQLHTSGARNAIGGQSGPQINKEEYGYADKASVNILHLSDLHVDPYYEFGANTDCGEPLCCRQTSAKSQHNSTAGYWGDYKGCDTPIYTIKELMKYINSSLTEKYEYLIWTGDITAHDVWNTTKDTIINGVVSLTQLINTYISNGKLVFPVIGNHEGLPVNQFSPPDITGPLSTDWLYVELLNEWRQWIPSEYHDTFRRFGYYSKKVSSTVKAIVLNTNYCARLNFWLLYDPIDVGHQLEWLESELHDAEQSGQSVHIIGHIPPDNSQCTPGWVHNYLLIVERYAHLIKGQFFGHSHFDEIRILYSSANKSLPIGVTYLGPSVTPYENMNPAFRLYSVDNTGTVLDHETYYLNLSDANVNRKHQSLDWVKEYSARVAYNISSLLASEWHSFLTAMRTDDRAFQSYYDHYHRFSDAFGKQCLDSCRDSVLDIIPVYDPIACTSD